MNDFQQRISYSGDLKPIMEKSCDFFNLGKYQKHTLVLIGYEDLNLVLITSRGKFFVKMFSSFRTNNDCFRYLEIVEKVIKSGVAHPKLFKGSNNEALLAFDYRKIHIRLCIMEYVDGKSFYQIGEKPNQKDMYEIAKQAAIINLIDYKPRYLDDSWAISNLLKGYSVVKDHLEQPDIKMIEVVVGEFQSFPFDSLPYSLVHGDLISTNVLKSKEGKIFFIDFSVTNYSPRIQELAILFCDLFFYQDKPLYEKNYRLILGQYQDVLPLTKDELLLLPTYIDFGHAMHIIGATKEKMNGNIYEENNYWLELGRKGLTNSKFCKEN